MNDFRPDRQPLVPPGGADLHARDMSATFAADVTLRSAQQRLAELGQWIPIDGDPDLPLGTLVERNSTGPLRLGYGAWRDLLLGLQFTNGRGELITAGGRTVKNVAGYDLTKFMVGSQGVFGRLVTITTRTYRRADRALVARFRLEIALLGRLLPTALRPRWAVLTPDALWCGYLGDEAALAFYRAALRSAEPEDVRDRTPDEDTEHRRALWSASGESMFRASVPPVRVQDFVNTARITDWAADAAFGIVLGPCGSPEDTDRIRSAAATVGGSLTVRNGRTEDPLSLDVSTTPAERRIIERLKLAFDPDKCLTPLPWQTR
jgi:FAD/FMN-containing dehydrogenase